MENSAERRRNVRSSVRVGGGEEFVRLGSLEGNHVSVSGGKGADKDGIRKHVSVERVVEFANG